MLNKVNLIGRVGKSPEIKNLSSGQSVANFSLATSENWTDRDGQKQERTEWHKIVAWGKLADLCCKYLSKGVAVFVEGKLQTRSWDGNDGQKRYTTEIIAERLYFLRELGDEKNKPASGPDTFVAQAKNDEDEEMPF